MTGVCFHNSSACLQNSPLTNSRRQTTLAQHREGEAAPAAAPEEAAATAAAGDGGGGESGGGEGGESGGEPSDNLLSAITGGMTMS